MRRLFDIGTGMVLMLLAVGILDFIRQHRYAGYRKVFTALRSVATQHPAETFASQFLSNPSAPPYVHYQSLHRFLARMVRLALFLVSIYVGVMVGLAIAAAYWKGSGIVLPANPLNAFFLQAVLLPATPEFLARLPYVEVGLVGLVFFNTLFGIGLARFAAICGFAATQPRLLFAPTRLPGYGVVFHGLSKLPVPLARVRLLRPDGRLLQTRYADWYGRYRFAVLPGEYRIEVRAPGFRMPTAGEFGRQEDAAWSDVLTSQSVRYRAQGFVTKNIPLMPTLHVRSPVESLHTQHLQRAHLLLAMVICLAACALLLVWPSLTAAVLLLTQSVAMLLLAATMERRMPTVLGTIRDARTGVPIPGAAVYLFDAERHTQIDVQLTDRQGRYGFIAGRNRYLITVTKNGYPPAAERRIDCTTGGDVCAIAPHLQLGPGY